MNQPPYRSSMPMSWRLAVFLAAVLAGVVGFFSARVNMHPKFDLLTCLFTAIVVAGLAGGTVVVTWFVFRTTHGDSDPDDED